MPSKLEAALAYASWGWYVLPVAQNGKVPATQHGVNDATTDPEKIKQWWQSNPDFNIGIAAGSKSGIVVFDIDPRNGGDESWAAWIKANGSTPDGAIQLTAGGGEHHIGAYEPIIKSCKLADGIDLLSDGRYFVAYPSTIDGRSYQWEASSDPFEGVAPFTIPEAWVRSYLSMRGQKANLNVASDDFIQGNRNDGLTAYAGAMRRIGASEAEILAAIRVANDARCEIPLPSSEVTQIARSVARYQPDTDVAASTALGSEAAVALTQQAESVMTQVRFDPDEIKLPIFGLDNIIEESVGMIAGPSGVGKTTNLVPLFLCMTHLTCWTELHPMLRRRVIYIAEDTSQVIRVIQSMRRAGHLNCSTQELHEWFILIDAKRMPARQLAKMAPEFSQRYATQNTGKSGQAYNTLPAMVLDTASANFELENENDNAEVSNIVATMKQSFKGWCVCIITHVAKTLKRADIAEYSARGASAWEGDVNQVMYLATDKDDGSRWLEVGVPKHRFMTNVSGIQFEPVVDKTTAINVLGDEQELTLIHGVPTVVTREERETRKKQKAQAKEDGENAAKELEKQQTRRDILELIKTAWEEGKTFSQNAAIELLGEQFTRKDIRDVFNKLVEDNLIVRVDIPAQVQIETGAIRVNPKECAYYLTQVPHEENHVSAFLERYAARKS